MRFRQLLELVPEPCQQVIQLSLLLIAEAVPRRQVIAIGRVLSFLAQRASFLCNLVAPVRWLYPAESDQLLQRLGVILLRVSAER